MNGNKARGMVHSRTIRNQMTVLDPEIGWNTQDTKSNTGSTLFKHSNQVKNLFKNKNMVDFVAQI